MFLNNLPILSFLILCWMLTIADEFSQKKKIFPEFLSNNTLAGIMGILILFWGLFQFYANFNYLIYQFRFNYIVVILRFLVIIYFIVCGFVLTFKGFGKYLYTKNKRSQENYQRTKEVLLPLQSILSKVGLLLIIINLVNYFLSMSKMEI